MLKTPQAKSELVLYRTRFESQQKCLDEGMTLNATTTFTNGIVLNGTTQSATIPGTKFNLIGKTSLTFEMWFTPTFAGNDGVAHAIIDTTAGAGARILIWKKVTDNAIEIYLGNTALTAITYATYGAYWYTNKRNHLVVAATSTSTLVYLNNNLIGTLATAWAQTTQPATFYVGVPSTGINYFAGTIHSFTIYNEKWTASQVTDAYNKSTFPELDAKRAKLWLPLRNKYVVGAETFTPNSGTIPAPEMGADGSYVPVLTTPNGATFDGADSLIDCGSTFNGTGDLTIGAIVKLTGFGESNTGRIFSNGKLGLFVSSASSYFGITSDGAITTVFSAVNSCNLGNVISIIVTRSSAGAANFYVNGVLSGTANQASGAPAAGDTNLIIGNNAARSLSFNGIIKTPFIFPAIFTLTQIRELHSRLMKSINL